MNIKQLIVQNPPEWWVVVAVALPGSLVVLALISIGLVIWNKGLNESLNSLRHPLRKDKNPVKALQPVGSGLYNFHASYQPHGKDGRSSPTQRHPFDAMSNLSDRNLFAQNYLRVPNPTFLGRGAGNAPNIEHSTRSHLKTRIAKLRSDSSSTISRPRPDNVPMIAVSKDNASELHYSHEPEQEPSGSVPSGSAPAFV